tara:strand:+ start:5627 stop:6211 length:585 start_codon:yes stop_codon:yes gene_type:complete
MSFWTEASLEPKRNFRFRITSDGWAEDGDPVWWWAKTIDKPSFDVSNSEYQLINHKFKYPGIVTWKNITMTLVDFADADSPNASEALEYELFLMGYSRPDEGGMMGLEKFTSRGDGAVANLIIEHLAADGKTAVDTWTLKGAFIISAAYSKLDYSSDDLSEVTLEIAYDYAHYGEIAGSSDTAPTAATQNSVNL